MYTLFILLEFEKWKHEFEEKHKCQFVKRTATKKVNGIEYSYHYFIDHFIQGFLAK